MVRRFILLLFVAGLSGAAGLWVGLLYAPAPGEETRKKLSAVLEEHEGTFADVYARGRQVFSDAVAVFSRPDQASGSGL